MAVIASHQLQRIGAEDVYDCEDGFDDAVSGSPIATPAFSKRIEPFHATGTAHARLELAPAPAASPQPDIFSADFMKQAQDVRVCSGTGLITHTRAKALIAMPAPEVYAVLTNADNSGIFRAFGSLTSFNVVRETADEMNVEAEQIAIGGLAGMKRKVPLAITGAVFPKALTGEYHLTRSGLMKSYEGFWSVTPIEPPAGQHCAWCQQRAQRAVPSSAEPAQRATQADDTIAASSEPCACRSGPHCSQRDPSHAHCLVWLCQDIEPNVPRALPLVKNVLRRLLHGETSDFLADLREVARLRSKGVPLQAILDNKQYGRA